MPVKTNQTTWPRTQRRRINKGAAAVRCGQSNKHPAFLCLCGNKQGTWPIFLHVTAITRRCAVRGGFLNAWLRDYSYWYSSAKKQCPQRNIATARTIAPQGRKYEYSLPMILSTSTRVRSYGITSSCTSLCDPVYTTEVSLSLGRTAWFEDADRGLLRRGMARLAGVMEPHFT